MKAISSSALKTILSVLVVIGLSVQLNSQSVQKKFGDGFRFVAKDTSFTTRIGFRFQNLVVAEWSEDENGSFGNAQINALVRRSRLKFDGFAFSPKLKYKLELGLSNRDIGGGGNSGLYNNGSKVILDAYINWNFFKTFSVQFGQGKLPGNRERVISSGNMQFVDRSRLNSRFNIDRDVGIMLKNKHVIGNKMIAKEVFSISQGEGRNITAGNIGGLDYTWRLELLPFGEFASKGDYIGAAIKYEEQPKLALGFTYDINVDAPRSRGQNGSFITFEDGSFAEKTINTFFADMMFKYQNWSIMAEYVHKGVEDSPVVRDENDEVVGTYYTGSGVNLAVGYMFDSNWELALRYTSLNPDEEVANDEQEYTLGISKYVVGHKLKWQTDIGYRDVTDSGNRLIYRMQMDLHF